MDIKLSKTDEYYIFIFNRMLTIAPLTGMVAGVTFTTAYIFGLFDSVPVWALALFNVLCLSYFLAAYLLRRYGIIRNGLVDNRALIHVGIILDALIILQWNAISYIFPASSFWGYAPMFVMISALLFKTILVLLEIIGISLSIAISWLIMGDKLMPSFDDQFEENLTLRIVALIISFSLIYILTSFAEKFTTLAKENYISMAAQNAELEAMSRDVIDFTADIIEERDSTSGFHVKRLKKYTKILAEQMAVSFPEYGLNEEIIENISLASALHDVGKIAIPDNILNKPGKLTPEEFDIIKTHTVLGAKIVDKLPDSIDSEYKRYCRRSGHRHDFERRMR